MSYQTIYVNKILAYDSRIREYALVACEIDEAVNAGGTCTITMPPDHPANALYTAFNVPVEVYCDGRLRWRGRPLPLDEDLYGQRTVTCEGELCFLNDAVLRPYLYQTDPKSIFSSIVTKYNARVEAWKQFRVGEVTVTDANNYMRFESETAETAMETISKLIDRSGGYIYFTTAADGVREINWYAEPPKTSNQEVVLGVNLIDYDKQANISTFATRCIPYGALQDDGSRLTINVGGKDYVQNDAAVKLRGVIETAQVWDDITLESNLIRRAQEWIDNAAQIPYAITLTALDLSKMGLRCRCF